MAGNKLTHTEVEERVSKCFELRYKADPPIQQKQWVKYCHENYNDKSEQQYIQYWISARERYEEGWRAKLNKMFGWKPNTEIKEGLRSTFKWYNEFLKKNKYKDFL